MASNGIIWAMIKDMIMEKIGREVRRWAYYYGHGK